MFEIKPIKLLKGSHTDIATTGQGCFMNVVAYLNGESQITDTSKCVCPSIRNIAVFLNDFATDEQRQLLLPFVLRALGSRTQDKKELKRRINCARRYAEFCASLRRHWKANIAATSALNATTACLVSYYAAQAASFIVSGASKETRAAVFEHGLNFMEEACPEGNGYVSRTVAQLTEALYERSTCQTS